jgi:hypothetical protein
LSDLQPSEKPKPKKKLKKRKKQKPKDLSRYSPEGLAAMRAWGAKLGKMKEGRKSGRIMGQPDGMPLKKFRVLEAAAKIKTQKVMLAMSKTKEFEPDNKVANQALEAAIEILCLPGNTSSRLSAAKLLLEYTQKKPVASSEVNLKTAESFLDTLIDDAEATSGT